MNSANNFKIKYVSAKLTLLFAASLTLSFFVTQGAYSQIAPTPCDPAYYQSLEQRAWLEAQREVTQNQNLITKPDSVLAYTCFEGYLFELADHADEMFSETTRWGNAVLGGAQADSMNNALKSLVLDSLDVYLESNFISPGDLRFMGGRSALTRGNIPSNIGNGQDYACDWMQQVWNEAKCYNFQEEPDDGFFTFQNYDADPNDKRAFPSRCAAKPDFGTPIQEAGLDPTTAPPWPIDQTFTYLDRFDPLYPGLSAPCGGFPPVGTGIQVTRAEQTPNNYTERVCIMAGCHYIPPGIGVNRCFP